MFFSCINICRVPRMLFEHEADRPSVQHHPRDPASVNAMKQTCVIVILQGRRRVFKSDPAEEAIECRRHERGESTRGGYSPSRLRGLPRENVRILSASMCVFNGFFMRLGPDFSRFGHKDISCRARKKPTAGQNVFQTVT